MSRFHYENDPSFLNSACPVLMILRKVMMTTTATETIMAYGGELRF